MLLGVLNTTAGRPPPPAPSSCSCSHARQPPECTSEHAHICGAPGPPPAVSLHPLALDQPHEHPRHAHAHPRDPRQWQRPHRCMGPRQALARLYKTSPSSPLLTTRPLSLPETPGPTLSPPRALHPSPWPEPCHRSPPKSAPISPPPSLWTALEHHHHHHEPLPCFSLSSPWLFHRAPSPPPASPASADGALASDHPCGHGAPRRMRLGLLNPPVCWASPGMAGDAGENAGTRSALPLLPLLCSSGR